MNRDFDKYSTLVMNGEEFDMVPIQPREEMDEYNEAEPMRDMEDNMEDEMFMNQYMPYDPMMDMYDFRPDGPYGGMPGAGNSVPGPGPYPVGIPSGNIGAYPGGYPGQGTPGGPQGMYPGAPGLYPNQPIPGTPSVPGALNPNPGSLYGTFPMAGMNSSGMPGFYEDAFMAGMIAPNSGRYEGYIGEFRHKHKKDYDKECHKDCHHEKEYHHEKECHHKEEHEHEHGYDDIRRIMCNIQNYNPGIYRAMRMYGIPYPMANRLIRRIVRLTLMYKD